MLKSSLARHMAGLFLPLAMAAACTFAQESSKYTGKVSSIDAANQTIVVADNNQGHQAIKITDGTVINTVKILALADIKSGDLIQAVGQMSPDNSSIKARTINIHTESKPRKNPAMAAGKAVVNDGKISIDVLGTSIAVNPDSQCSVSKVTPGNFNSIKTGMFAICNMGEKGVAKVIALREMPGKQPSAPTK